MTPTEEPAADEASIGKITAENPDLTLALVKDILRAHGETELEEYRFSKRSFSRGGGALFFLCYCE